MNRRDLLIKVTATAAACVLAAMPSTRRSLLIEAVMSFEDSARAELLSAAGWEVVRVVSFPAVSSDSGILSSGAALAL